MRRTMLTVFALAAALCTVSLLSDGSADTGASETDAPETGAMNPEAPQSFRQVGRFQIMQGQGEDMYMVDTMKGDVYRRTLGDGWYFEGNPIELRVEREREQAAQQREQAEKEGAKLKGALELPRAVVHMTIDQRSTEAIPGSNERMFVHLGDITEGRVRVTAFSIDGAMLIDHVAMRPGQIFRFKVDGESVFLKLLELKNALLGTDVAEFEISKSRELLTGEEESAEKEAGRAR